MSEATGSAEVPAIVARVDEGLWCIDLQFQGVPGVIAAWLLSDGNHSALIETGPSSTLPALRAGLEEIGVSMADLDDVVVSHIHLDHAGAAAHVAAAAPHATIHVHPVGAPHLIDPARLWASASRIYGDRMERLWGDAGPVPAERINVVEDGQRFRVAGRDLTVLFTPGHAGHHIALHDPALDAVFTGDSAGVRVPGSGYVCPPVPPPELDIPLWHHTISRLRDLGSRRLFLTHFGVVDDAGEHLGLLSAHLDAYRDIARVVLERGGDQDALTAVIHEQMEAGVKRDDDATPASEAFRLQELELATPSYMAAMGIERYLRKHEGFGSNPG